MKLNEKNISVINCNLNFNKLLLSLLLVVSFENVLFAQQNNTMFYMNDLPQTSYVRSSLYYQDLEFYIGLPIISSLYINSNNTDLLYGIYPKSFIKHRELSDYQNHQLHVDLLSVGFKYKDYYLNFAIQEKISIQYSIPSSAQSFFKDLHILPGIDSDFSGTNLDVTHYREFSFGMSSKYSDKLSYGVKFKYLTGLANVSMKINKFVISVDDKVKNVNVIADIELLASGPGYELTDSLYSAKVLDAIKREQLNNRDMYVKNKTINPIDYIFNLDNQGFATDFSFEYQFSEDYLVSIGVVDIGYINWTTNTLTVNPQLNDYNFNGLNFENSFSLEKDVSSSLKDSILNKLELTIDKGSYMKFLNPKLYTGIQRHINDNIDAGLLMRNEFLPKTINTMLTLSINSMVTDNLELVASWSVYNYEWKNIGAGLSYNLGNLQFYIVSDNVLGPIVKDLNQNINLRFGLNLIFRKNRRENEKKLRVEKCLLCD